MHSGKDGKAKLNQQTVERLGDVKLWNDWHKMGMVFNVWETIVNVYGFCGVSRSNQSNHIFGYLHQGKIGNIGLEIYE